MPVFTKTLLWENASKTLEGQRVLIICGDFCIRCIAIRCTLVQNKYTCIYIYIYISISIQSGIGQRWRNRSTWWNRSTFFFM